MSLMARWVLTYRGRGGRSATRPEVHVRSGRGRNAGWSWRAARLKSVGWMASPCGEGVRPSGTTCWRRFDARGASTSAGAGLSRPVGRHPPPCLSSVHSSWLYSSAGEPLSRGLGHDRTASGRTVSGWLCRLSVQPRRGVGVGSRNADGCLCRGRADRTTRPAAPKTVTARAPVSLVTPTYRTPPERPSLARCDGRPGPDPRGRPSPADLIVSPTPDCAFTKVASRRPARCHSAPVRPACMTTARGRGWIGHHFAGTGRVTFGLGRSRVLETLQSVGDL